MRVGARTPVIVGVGQTNQRAVEAAEAREPVDLMASVATAAAADAGCGELLAKLDSLRVVRGIWPYRDPGRLVAERLRIGDVRTAINEIGGQAAQELLLSSAADIESGARDVVLVCAAETMRTRRRDRRAGRRTKYAEEPAAAAADEIFADPRPMLSEAEVAAGIEPPRVFYAMVENAIRHRQRESADTHRERISELWSSLSRVAAGNPDAWSRRALDAEQIRAVGPDNRLVVHPYTKWMTSNINVDQAVAVLLCSAATARALGIASDRWVFPWSGTHAHDHWLPSERHRLDESPAMRIAGRRALELAGLTAGEVDLVDLYSCFPAAVQVAQRELAIDPHIVPTLTGGLTFAGGPFNSYVLHAVARLVDLLRKSPSSRGLITGNGGYFTKHSFGVYGGEPPSRGFALASPQAAIDALPTRRADDYFSGFAEIEAYTATYGRSGDLDAGIIAALTPDGARVWARSEDQKIARALLEADACGRRARVDGGTLLGVE